MQFSPKTWLFRLHEHCRRRVRLIALAGVIAGIAFWIHCGVQGIDFGYHWDEDYEVGGVRSSVKKMMILPQWYTYGNVYFLVGMAVVMRHHTDFPSAFLAEMRKRVASSIAEIETYSSVLEFQRTANDLLASPRYILETRQAFLWLSCLTGLWVYLFLRKLYPRRTLGPLAAAAFIVFSWELQYHARFIAMDTLVTQLVALELLLLLHAGSTVWPRTRLLCYCGAAVAAGLAFSCKAPALVGFIPLGMLPFLLRGRFAILRRTALAALGGLVAACTTFIMQPALLVDPLRFLATLASQSYEYNLNYGHPSYTKDAFDRLTKFLEWLWLALPSPYPGVALFLSAVAIVGLLCLVYRHPRVALLFAGIAGMLFVTMLHHPLFIVRQYLMLSSMLAAGFGLGVMELYDLLAARPWAARAFVLGLAAVFFMHGRFLHAAAQGIRDLTDEKVHRLAADELLRRPRPIRLSPQLKKTLAPLLEAGYRCPGEGAAEANAEVPVVVRANEHAWHANVFGFARRFFGSREVNYDWYPTWVGRPDRPPILILSAEHARGQKLPFGQYMVCEPRAPK
jgi:hypothetical protein